MKKKGILFWFEMDRRLELLQPFINMRDEIEFVHLYYRKREERDIALSPFEMIYWFDYKSPYQLLAKHRPDFIIGGTENLLAIALIVAAKEKNIPFYGLQHGFSTENFVSVVKKVVRKSPFSLPALKNNFNTARFYFSAFRLKNIASFFQYVNLFVLFYSRFPEEAIIKNRYSWVKPPHYLCFSEISARHYKELYGLHDREISYIGIPSFDDLFLAINNAKHEAPAEKYYLLIDTSFIDYYKPISDETIQRCYQVLKEYCRQRQAKLYIKLHPRNYSNPGLHDDDSIRFVRNMEMNGLAGLIVHAEGCFGFYSTLTMPVAFTIPTIQVKYDDVFEKNLVENGITPVLDFYTFGVADIAFNSTACTDEELKRKFLFSTDGKAVERIKQILLS